MLRGKDARNFKEFFTKEFGEFKGEFIKAYTAALNADTEKVLEAVSEARKREKEEFDKRNSEVMNLWFQRAIETLESTTKNSINPLLDAIKPGATSEEFQQFKTELIEGLVNIGQEIQKLAENPVIEIDPTKFDVEEFKKLNPGCNIQLVNTAPVIEVEDDPAPQKRGPGRPPKKQEE